MKKGKQFSLVVVLAVLVVGLGLGFFGGMEYKAYQLRKALFGVSEALSGDQSNTPEQKKDSKIIQKQMNEDVELATINLKVVNSEEKQTLNVSYDTPRVAKEGRKFVVVTAEITNTTTETFSFFPTGLEVVDDKNRAYEPYSDGYGTANFLSGRDLAPDLVENGTMIFEVPQEISSYSLSIGKAGTNEVYRISLN